MMTQIVSNLDKSNLKMTQIASNLDRDDIGEYFYKS